MRVLDAGVKRRRWLQREDGRARESRQVETSRVRLPHSVARVCLQSVEKFSNGSFI